MGKESATLLLGATISGAVLTIPDVAAQAVMIGLLVIGIPASIGGGLLMARWREATR